jgi:hypothetical protein
MTSARRRVAEYWDEHVAAWMAGDNPLPEALARWFASYEGGGAGQVTREGFPEPYVGDLLGQVTTPRMVILGLNPGRYHPQFQARDGIFANEIRQYGCYSVWARTGPYLREPWTEQIGHNRYVRARRNFMRRWLQDPAATHDDLLIFEAYPWHSTSITASMRPPADVVDEFVWQPIAELPTQEVFAFGRPWHNLLKTLDLSLIDALGAGGHDYGSAVPSRAIRVYKLPSGQRLIIEWHPGGAGPPSETEVAALKAALT